MTNPSTFSTALANEAATANLMADLALLIGAGDVITLSGDLGAGKTAAARALIRYLAGDPDIVTYTTYVGQGSPRFWLGLNPVLPNPNFAQVVIVTKDLDARER